MKTLANTNWEKNSTKPYLKRLKQRRPTAMHLLQRRSLSFISRYVTNSRSPFLRLPCFPLSSSLHLFPSLGFISHGFLPLPWFFPFRLSQQSNDFFLIKSIVRLHPIYMYIYLNPLPVSLFSLHPFLFFKYSNFKSQFG